MTKLLYISLVSVAMLMGVVHSASAHKNNILDGVYTSSAGSITAINDTLVFETFFDDKDVKGYPPGAIFNLGKFVPQKLSDEFYRFVRISEHEPLLIQTKVSERSHLSDSVTVKLQLSESFLVPFYWCGNDGMYHQSDSTVVEFRVRADLDTVNITIVPDPDNYITMLHPSSPCFNCENLDQNNGNLFSSFRTLMPTSFHFQIPTYEGMNLEVYAPNIGQVALGDYLIDGLIFRYKDNMIGFNNLNYEWLCPPKGVDFPYEWEIFEPKIPK